MNIYYLYFYKKKNGSFLDDLINKVPELISDMNSQNLNDYIKKGDGYL